MPFNKFPSIYMDQITKSYTLQGRSQYCLKGAAIWMKTAQNTLETATGDGNILPLGDMASISRTIGRLITPFERDLLHACAPQRLGQRRQIQQRILHQNLLKKLGNPAFSGSSVEVSAEEDKITKFGGEHLPE